MKPAFESSSLAQGEREKQCSGSLSEARASVSVSAQDGIVASERPIRATPCLSAVSPMLLHSSFLQAINALMLWPVYVQKVPQASEHLCPAKLQSRCDVCCACQSICPFTPTARSLPLPDQDSRSTKVFVAEDRAWLCTSQGSPFQTPPFARGLIESLTSKTRASDYR